MKKHFLTFGDSLNYRNSLARIEQEVAAMDFFDSYTISNETSLPEFIDFHREFFSGNRTGYGFWIWKPYLVGQALEAMADGDILLYCDSGCQFNINERSLKRLQEYFDMLAASEHATLSFELIHKERDWTKRDCFEALGAQVDDSRQLVGGIFLIQKCQAATDLIAGINQLISSRQYSLFDNSPTVAPNEPSFAEHRNDQSIFSLKRKLAGTLIIPDETWFEDWDDGADFPIHARRFR
ncbi:MAG: hypothetical protein KAY12_01645 [Arenimonas sp.]|nr:hypothetical protein [Arenimonas sp.]